MMKKIKAVFMVFALACILCMPAEKVFAANVSSLNATGSSGSVTVSGTADSGVTAVAIMVYDSTGTDLVVMESASVSDSHTFTDTISLSAGSYVIKVADYEGGAFTQTTVTVAAGSSNQQGNANSSNSSSQSNGSTTASEQLASPKTEDINVIVVMMFLVIAALGVNAGTTYIRKKKA